MTSILKVIPQPWPIIRVLDLGAMDMADVTPGYQRLLDLGLCHVIGFEPVASECEKLNRRAATGRLFLPHAVGDGGARELRVCNFSMTSSLYEPNEALCSKFQNLAELMQVVDRVPLETRRLDEIDEVANIDYIKMDIQGAELDAIRGGQRVIGNALVIETEVEFVSLYVDQPLFADVDVALRDMGFLFHRFLGIAGRAFKPIVVNQNPNVMLSQALWSDAIYAKSFMRLDDLEPARLLKMAIILHEMYGSVDLSHFILSNYDDVMKTTLAPAYLELLVTGDPQ